MIVVADTSPLNYLVQLQLQHVLAELYGRILIAEEVANELRAQRSPAEVRIWISAPPHWLEIAACQGKLSAATAALDLGERAAIQ